jgi:hypothetical protein
VPAQTQHDNRAIRIQMQAGEGARHPGHRGMLGISDRPLLVLQARAGIHEL